MGFVDKATYKNARAILLKSGWVATFFGWVQNGFSRAIQGLGVADCGLRPLSYMRPLPQNAT